MVGSARTPPLTGAPGAEHSIQLAESIEDSDGSSGTYNQEQLKADGELLDRVMLAGFEGPEWERLRRTLAEYAIRVVRSWIRSGRMVRECARRGARCPALSQRSRSLEESSDLAVDTVAEALWFFREEVLGKGLWDRTKGASLKTFFVGACVLHFRNVYRTWTRSQRGMEIGAPDRDGRALMGVLDDRPDGNPERRIVNASVVRAALADVDPVTREMLALDAEGESHEDIGRRFGKTAHAVESRLFRLRARYT